MLSVSDSLSVSTWSFYLVVQLSRLDKQANMKPDEDYQPIRL